MADDFDTVDQAYKKIGARMENGELALVGRDEKVIVLVWDAFGLIGNGGLERYLNSSCSWELAPDAFEAIGESRVAEALRTALNQFETGQPSADPEIRKREVSRFRKEQEVLYDMLNSIIWKAGDSIVRSAAQFVRKLRETGSAGQTC